MLTRPIPDEDGGHIAKKISRKKIVLFVGHFGNKNA